MLGFVLLFIHPLLPLIGDKVTNSGIVISHNLSEPFQPPSLNISKSGLGGAKNRRN